MKRDTQICMSSCAQNNDKIYFSSKMYNVIGELNLETAKINILCQIPGYGIGASSLLGKILFWNNHIITLPSCDDKIRFYNLRSKEWHEINIDKKGKNAGFFDGVIVGVFLYAVDSCQGRIVKISLKERKVVKIIKPYKENDKRDIYLGIQLLEYQGKLYFPDYRMNRILELNIANDQFKWIRVDNDVTNGFVAIAQMKESFALASTIGKGMVMYCPKTEEINVVVKKDSEITSYYYGGLVSRGDRLIAPSPYNCKLMVVNGDEVKEMETKGGFDCIQTLSSSSALLADEYANIQILENFSFVKEICCEVDLYNCYEREMRSENPGIFVENTSFSLSGFVTLLVEDRD